MSGMEVRPCARCGEVEVYGNRDSLTCCETCAMSIALRVAAEDRSFRLSGHSGISVRSLLAEADRLDALTPPSSRDTMGERRRR